MKTRINRKRRAPSKQRVRRTRYLSIEILEPRLTLSYVGFVAGANHGQGSSIAPDHHAAEVTPAPIPAHHQGGHDRHESRTHHDVRPTALPKPLAPPAPPQISPSGPGPIDNPNQNAPPVVVVPPASQPPRVTPSPNVGVESEIAATSGGSRAVNIPLPLFDASQVENSVSFAAAEQLNWWSSDSISLDGFFESVGRTSQVVVPSASSGLNSRSMSDSLSQPDVTLSSSLLGVRDSEGGLIEIEPKRNNELDKRLESSDDIADTENTERDLKRTPRDTFWFDIDDDELDSILDPADAYDLTEEDVPTGPASEDDEGGMIFLTTTQVTDEEASIPATPLPTEYQPQPSHQGKIPMVAGLGFYRAVEVATTLIDSPGEPAMAEEAGLPEEGEAASDAVDPVPTTEQATTDSESGNAETTTAASTPLWLAAAAFFSRSRRKRKRKGRATA
jgi:hypothetical protein